MVPADRLLDEALALAERIAENAPLAVRHSKDGHEAGGRGPRGAGVAINDAAVGVVFASADAMEGPVAFAEKRAPNWQGK